MQLTHYGHSCMLLDTGAARILFDPGSFSAGFEPLTGLDAVLVTHQHPDHLDRDRVGALLRANPNARLVVDPGSTQGLDVDHEVVTPGSSFTVAGAQVEVLGGDHAVIHPDIPMIPNNSYLVDGALLHPGDAFTPPQQPVDVLLLPAGAPWLKISEAIDYLRLVAPRVAVPIHEAVLAMPKMNYDRFAELGPRESTVRVLDRQSATRL